MECGALAEHCPVCGKFFVTMWREHWVYRRGPTYYCSEDCMFVDATKNMKLIKMLAHVRAKKGSKNMMKITPERKKKAVEIALSGKNPLKYLKECGIKAPDKIWYAIKAALKEKDPELYARIPDFRKADKETPEQAPTVKLSGPIRIETPEANKVEIVETPEKEKEKEFGLPAYINGFEIIGIRGQFGTYRASSEYNYFEFVPFGGELCMNPGDWREQLEELQKAAKVLGVKL